MSAPGMVPMLLQLLLGLRHLIYAPTRCHLEASPFSLGKPCLCSLPKECCKTVLYKFWTRHLRSSRVCELFYEQFKNFDVSLAHIFLKLAFLYIVH